MNLLRRILFMGLGGVPGWLALTAMFALPGYSRTWTVAADGTGELSSIQAAIDSATSGDTVLVGPGSYDENVDMSAKEIVLLAVSGADRTIVDARRRGRVLALAAGVVEGFTLRNGLEEFFGAGIYVTGPGPTVIRNNVIEDNVAGLAQDTGVGGGVYLGQDGRALLESNIIRNNSASYAGGGVWDDGLASEIRENLIMGNRSDVLGGGVVAGFATALLYNVIANNFAASAGAGVYVDRDLVSEVHNNTIIGNRTSNGILHGAGIHSNSDGAVISNNIVAENHSGGIGGRTGVGIVAPVASCNNTWGNDVDEIMGPTGDRNFSRDPEFCAVDPVMSLNFTLQTDSPCAPGHDPYGGDCGLLGAGPVACGPVNVQSSTWSAIKRMFR